MNGSFIATQSNLHMATEAILHSRGKEIVAILKHTYCSLGWRQAGRKGYELGSQRVQTHISTFPRFLTHQPSYHGDFAKFTQVSWELLPMLDSSWNRIKYIGGSPDQPYRCSPKYEESQQERGGGGRQNLSFFARALIN